MPSTIRLFSKAMPAALLLLLLATAPASADVGHIQVGTVKFPFRQRSSGSCSLPLVLTSYT